MPLTCFILLHIDECERTDLQPIYTHYYYTHILPKMANWFEHIPDSVKAVIVPIYIVIISVGAIGNVMVPIVILKTKDLRNSTNIFLINLSIADLVMLVMFAPNLLMEIMYDHKTWVTGIVICKTSRFVLQMLIHVSVLTIVALSFERYYAICQPLKAGYICTNKRAAIICALVWFFAALLASPIIALVIFQNFKKDDGTVIGFCYARLGIFWHDLYFILIAIVIFVIPLVILVVIYSLITKNLMTTSAIIAQNANTTNNSSNVIRYRKRVILMLGAVIISFFVCFLPREILRLPRIIYPEVRNWFGEDYIILILVSRIMPIWHSGINPILYNLMSSKFRAGFVKLLRLNNFTKCSRNLRKNTQSQDTLNTITTISSRV